MRVLLLGSTEITERVAAELVTAAELVGVVYTSRDFAVSYAPAGVRNYRHADVTAWASRAGVEAFEFESLRELRRRALELRAEFCMVCGWYHMVDAETRAVFERGCAGIHASLLPRLRGGAPLNWAILNGDEEAGVSLFELGDGIDDGAIYAQRVLPIGPRTYVGDLVEASIEAACEVVAEAIPRIADGTLAAQPQRGRPTYGLQRAPLDGWIDWTRGAACIDRLVRAVSHPYPGAWTSFEERKLVIWASAPAAPDAPAIHGAPGQLVVMPWDRERVGVVTGDGVLLVEQASWGDGEDALPDLRAANQRRCAVSGMPPS